MVPEEAQGIFEAPLEVGDLFFGADGGLFLESPHQIVDKCLSIRFALREYFVGICIEI